ncbi:MAG: DUF4345 domain-containing protein [Planctomycetes bacterium]|nr:DUF4345 domain-containing protein [Planctomycetota bacterium]
MIGGIPLAAALVTALLGCAGLVWPAAVANVVGIEPRGALGLAEIRATYGGFFLALGVACLFTRSPMIFTVVGVAWYAAAFGRALSLAVTGTATRRDLGGVAFEAAIGVALLTARA